MWNQKPSFRFEIDNFSEKKGHIVSKTFVSGGCKWFLNVFPKGEYLLSKKEIEYHLALYLFVENPSLLQPGWKRTVNFYFAVLNQSNKELYRSPIPRAEFGAKTISCGFPKTLPLSLFQEKGFLEEDKLIIEVYIEILEAVDGERGYVSEKKEVVDINGFRVFASQVTSVRKIFAEHPDIATYVKLKNQVVRTEYMNVLLRLVNTLNKPSENISVHELGTGLSELKELTQVGFDLDWLKTKLVKVSSERITLNVDGSRIQELEERLKKLELMESNLKLDSLKRKLDEVDSERKKAKADEPWVQKLEERVKNLEMVESGFMMDSLKSKLENVSLEQKKPYDADGSRIQELEESVEDLKKMVSDLKAKLDKDEAKSSDDEFLLVNEVA